MVVFMIISSFVHDVDNVMKSFPQRLDISPFFCIGGTISLGKIPVFSPQVVSSSVDKFVSSFISLCKIRKFKNCLNFEQKNKKCGKSFKEACLLGVERPPKICAKQYTFSVSNISLCPQVYSQGLYAKFSYV